MKDEICGVVLAGGWGTRLMPLTTSTNKHLLPVYDEPMICKSISVIKKMGIRDIMVVLGGHSGNEFFHLLGDGHRLGLEIRYAYQEQAGGIAEALRLTRDFVGERNVAVILGDNVFEESMEEYSSQFVLDEIHECYLFLKEVEDPSGFGIAWLDESGKIKRLEEKPKQSDSKMAITGLYLYSSKVFELIDKTIETVGYSRRGELEITDINRFFVELDLAKGIKFGGHWADCGTIDSLLDTSNLVKKWKISGDGE